MEKPKTTWEDTAKTDDGTEMPRWLECRLCHKTDLVFASLSEQNNYVCQTCRARSGEAISMRCLRHKKRFNVPRWWLKVSSYLCPKCYERLGEEDRRQYAPREGTVISCREADPDKGLVSPSRLEQEYQMPLISIGEPPEACRVTEENQGASISMPKEGATKAKKPIKPKKKGFVLKNIALAGLLPKYKILCKRCGETVPCHYVWFDRSTVLCPDCYGQMTDEQIQMFHRVYKADRPKYEKDLRPIPDTTSSGNVEDGSMEDGLENDDIAINNWSNYRIMNASKTELFKAVKCGKVSLVRARIELERRNNSAYYDLFPVEVGTALVKF